MFLELDFMSGTFFTLWIFLVFISVCLNDALTILSWMCGLSTLWWKSPWYPYLNLAWWNWYLLINSLSRHTYPTRSQILAAIFVSSQFCALDKIDCCLRVMPFVDKLASKVCRFAISWHVSNPRLMHQSDIKLWVPVCQNTCLQASILLHYLLFLMSNHSSWVLWAIVSIWVPHRQVLQDHVVFRPLEVDLSYWDVTVLDIRVYCIEWLSWQNPWSIRDSWE